MPDDEQNRFGRSLGEGYSYVALGFTFAVAILAFGALGGVVDEWLGTRPGFPLVGAAIGALGGARSPEDARHDDRQAGGRAPAGVDAGGRGGRGRCGLP